MNQAIENLKKWFNGLSNTDKQAVYEYLYGEGSYTQGVYLGPHKFGIKTGPAPSSKAEGRCPTCGKSW